MVNNSVDFIRFKAVQQGFNTIPFSKYSESIRLDFSKKTFLAVYFTKIAVFFISFNGAASVFTPFFIGTIT